MKQPPDRNDRERPVAVSATEGQRSSRPQPVPAEPAATPPPHPPSAPATPPLTQRDFDTAMRSKPRARRFAGSALRSSAGPTTVALRRLVGERIRDVDGRMVGKVAAVEADGKLADGWVTIEEGRGGRRYFVPADRVDGGAGGAYTSLRRDQIVATSRIAHGRLGETTERLLREHYAPTATDRSRYSALVARERVVRRARAATSQRDRQRPT